MEKLIYFIRLNIRLLLGLAVVIFFVLVGVYLLTQNTKETFVAVNDSKFQVEIAQTDTEKQIGLSNTESLPEDEGMLFLFDTPDYYSFWMRDMQFPIDIIFINGNKVTTVISNALPPSETGGSLPTFQPTEKSDKVLEVNAGIAKKYNITEGSVIDINNL